MNYDLTRASHPANRPSHLVTAALMITACAAVVACSAGSEAPTEPSTSNGTQEATLTQDLSSEKGSPLRAGSRGSDPIPELGPASGERVIDTSRNSPFSGTALAADLRAR